MLDSGWALQTSIHARLTADPAVIAALGSARIYDDVPRGAEFPYVTFGETTLRDWSTGGEEGSEHIVTLHVWSHAAGRREAQAVMGAVRTALHDQPLSLAGHRLVNLRHEFSDARRDPDGETYHGIVRLRAVTEPL